VTGEQITTTEELEALPDGVLVRGALGHVFERGSACEGHNICDECLESWPCRTSRLIAFTEAILGWPKAMGVSSEYDRTLSAHDINALAEQHIGAQP